MPQRESRAAELVEGSGKMSFVLMRAEYDHHTERAYVEFRQPDADAGGHSGSDFFPTERPNG